MTKWYVTVLVLEAAAFLGIIWIVASYIFTR